MRRHDSRSPGGPPGLRVVVACALACALAAGFNGRADGWRGPGGAACGLALAAGGCVADARAAREHPGGFPPLRRVEVRGLSATSQRPAAPARTALLALAAVLLGLAALSGRVVR